MKETPDVYRSTKWLIQEYEQRVKEFKLAHERGEHDRTTQHDRKVALDTNFKAALDVLAEKLKNGELDGGE